jgi:uncharacterized membrane protein YecN with MAPEG domain
MITFTFAGLFGLFYVFLSAKTIKTRRKAQVAVGTSDNDILTRAVRAHGNFFEYTVFAIILAYFNEVNGLNKYFIAALLSAFLVGRISHFYGITIAEIKNKNFKFRVFGMAISLTVISILSIALFS